MVVVVMVLVAVVIMVVIMIMFMFTATVAALPPIVIPILERTGVEHVIEVDRVSAALAQKQGLGRTSGRGWHGTLGQHGGGGHTDNGRDDGD